MRAIIATETGGALLAARQSFHCQFSVRARRPDSWRATSSRPIINSTVRELDYKLGRSSAQIGRRDFPEDLDYDCMLWALRAFQDASTNGLINARRTGSRAPFIRYKIFIRSLSNDRNVGTCPMIVSFSLLARCDSSKLSHTVVTNAIVEPEVSWFDNGFEYASVKWRRSY